MERFFFGYTLRAVKIPDLGPAPASYSGSKLAEWKANKEAEAVVSAASMPFYGALDTLHVLNASGEAVLDGTGLPAAMRLVEFVASHWPADAHNTLAGLPAFGLPQLTPVPTPAACPELWGYKLAEMFAVAGAQVLSASKGPSVPLRMSFHPYGVCDPFAIFFNATERKQGAENALLSAMDVGYRTNVAMTAVDQARMIRDVVTRVYR